MDWINATLDLNLSKVEETASGAVACQLFDIMYPNQVPMHKVNWAAKQDFEYISNYKILQTCFTKMNIDRNIDVDRLISARYMDNLEFMQWYKRFFEMTVTDKGGYDAYSQRSKGKGGAIYGGGKKSNQSKSSIASAPSRQPAVSKPQTSSESGSNKHSNSHNTNQENAVPNKIVSSTSANSNHSKGAAASLSHVVSSSSSTDSSASSSGMDHNSAKLIQENNHLKAANTTLTQTLADTRGEMEGLEKERDFYFDKLRDIEVMLQDMEDKGQSNDLSASIFKVLYATIDGFEPVPTALEPVASGGVSAMVSHSDDFEAY